MCIRDSFYDGNIARGYRASINIAMKAVEKGVLPIDKLESVLFQEVTAKGDKRRLLIDKLGGGAVKLVDRLEFSYNNFSPNILKGWDKPR